MFYPYGYGYYGYGDFLANNLYVLLLIPVMLLSLWAQFQVSGNFRRYNAVNNRRRRRCCGPTGSLTWASVCAGGT